MKDIFRACLAYSTVFAILFMGMSVHAQTPGSDSSSLRTLIEQKAAELQKVQTQKEVVQKSLDEVSNTSNSLKKEINNINGAITQLNLSIKGNKLSVDKLGLELEELDDTIVSTQERIVMKKDAIRKLFVELQQRENSNLLEMLLRSETLSKGVRAIHTINDINTELASTVQELKSLQGDLEDQRTLTYVKRQQKEVEQVTLASRQQIVQEQKTEKQKLLEVTKNQETVYQKQLFDLEKLQADISDEIEKIESELRKGIDPNLLPFPRPGALLWPVNGGHLTQGYGTTAFALRNYKGKYHNGVDVGAPLGTEIFAAEDGRVINVGDQDKFCRKGAYGKFIVIKHENGLTTLYGHLSGYIVSIGTLVKKGQLIGYVGKTGWATGPHLHFTVFASQTLTPVRPGYPEGTQPSRICGPMPVGGDLDPTRYLFIQS